MKVKYVDGKMLKTNRDAFLCNTQTDDLYQHLKDDEILQKKSNTLIILRIISYMIILGRNDQVYFKMNLPMEN